MGDTETAVRRATLDDVERTAVLFARYRQFYGKQFDEEAALAFLRERLDCGQSVVLYAERGGRVTGFLQLYPGFSSISLAPAWTLNDLYVEESERKTGVATLLIHEAEKIARASAAVSLALETAHDNDAARRLYDRLGYVPDSDFVSYAKSLD